MDLILITTLPNQVASNLQSVQNLRIKIIDTGQYENFDNEDFESHLLKLVTSANYDLLLTYRCRFIIPAKIRKYCKRCINIHPTRLPEFAGLNPWIKVKDSGITASEVSIHDMTNQPDCGKIIATKNYSFDNFEQARFIADMTAAELITELLTSEKLILK